MNIPPLLSESSVSPHDRKGREGKGREGKPESPIHQPHPRRRLEFVTVNGFECAIPVVSARRPWMGAG